MKKIFFNFIGLILLSALLLGCNADPIKTERTNNSQINSQLLFEKDGYKIYRFSDGSRNVYYIIPYGQVTETHTESCGKSCVTDVNTQSITLSNLNKK